jgi:uncharacterized membrane protein (DUF106 family)
MEWLNAFIVGTIAIVYSAFLFLYQRYQDKKNNTKEKNLKSKELQKQISDLYKNKDVKDPEVMKEIQALQKEMMSISTDMMKSQFKGMIWIMLLGLIVLSVIGLFQDAKFPVGSFWIFSQVLSWFILISLVANLLYKGIFKLLEKQKLIE